ncbi:ABC transporter ATP-binding protein [Jeotgalibacillus sp. S-D1]|uniref:ABC transporter ATP-binding protein n=1 Tax=Jeotgalibacillus sp. S-D1 TaxID=2552189 RepID=UPI00140477B8|nr:ABC transporter ATP-binding protein [Jeotgalibacillus sp. S-D1]
MIQVEHLTKTFGSTDAVKDLNFSLRPGKTTALIGPNGAGKTTTLHMISGLMKPTAGKINYTAQKEDPRELIGFLPQYPAFFDWMTAEEYVHFAAQLGKKTKKEAVSLSDELLDRVGLHEVKKKKIGGFSGGMKQRLGIAQALVHRPKLLLLDEPVSALDPTGRKEVMQLLNEIKKDLTILYSTHVLHDAQTLCDDVLMMNRGKKVVYASLEEIYKQYDRPRITIKTDNSIEPWAKSFAANYPFLTIEVKNGEATISGSSINIVRQHLFKELSSGEIAVRSIEVGTSTLEDVFHEVMKP